MGKPLKKGQAPPAYYEGVLEPYKFNNLPPERLKEMARKSAEVRRKRRQDKMFLQKCMKELLGLDIKSEKQKELLRKMGIKDTDLQNQTLLMVALFLKGTKGDVAAIKEIVEMMDKLDILEDTGKVTQGININLIPVGRSTEAQEDDDIWGEEDMGAEEEAEDEDWGNDVF